MSDDSNPEAIHLERFLTVMNVILKDRRYQGQPESKILRAFQVLDRDNKGYLSEEELQNYLCKDGQSYEDAKKRVSPSFTFFLGDPFTDEEFQDFMVMALDDESNRICTYKDFLQQLVVEDND
jgi:Ca2+-binding EF-hand superfamily protein